MKKIVQNYIIYAITAALLYFFGVYLVLDYVLGNHVELTGFFAKIFPGTVGTTISIYFVGALIICYAIILFVSLIKKTNSQVSKAFLLIELILNLLSAIMMMIKIFQPYLAIGLVVLLRGLNELMACYFQKFAKASKFACGIILACVGAYEIGAKLIKGRIFFWILVVIVFALAILCTVYAAKYGKLREKKVKEQKQKRAEKKKLKEEKKIETKKTETKKIETKTEKKSE